MLRIRDRQWATVSGTAVTPNVNDHAQDVDLTLHLAFVWTVRNVIYGTYSTVPTVLAY